MRPIECDVFSFRSMTLDSADEHYGNIYVDGNLSLDSIEIFGDIYVTGSLHCDSVAIHGNLECATLRCDEITVDGDIIINRNNYSSATKQADGYVEVNYEIISLNGDIYIYGAAEIPNLTALDGSIYVRDTLTANAIKAFDSIYVGDDLIDVEYLASGKGVKIDGNISFEQCDRYCSEFNKLHIYSGGIKSKNIKIN